MGFILKASPDLDLYCEWSSIVDAPVFIGTKQEILAYLTHYYGHDSSREIVEAAERSTRLGTSERDLNMGDWEDTGLAVQNFGSKRMDWLPRAKFAEFFSLYFKDRAAAEALLEESDPC
jgi:hypothetical protein